MSCKEKPPSLRKTRLRQRGGRLNIREIQGNFGRKSRTFPGSGGIVRTPALLCQCLPAPLYAPSCPHTTQHGSTPSLHDHPHLTPWLHHIVPSTCDTYQPIPALINFGQGCSGIFTKRPPQPLHPATVLGGEDCISAMVLKGSVLLFCGCYYKSP